MTAFSIRQAVCALISALVLAPVAAGEGNLLDPVALTAGAFTINDQSEQAYSAPIAALSAEQAEAFAKGKEHFNEIWVVAPEPGVWGLGPTFNEDRCSHCHINNGRAKAPEDGQPAEKGLLVRLSIAGIDTHGGPRPHPNYGEQLQNRGVKGRVPAEGQAIFNYAAREVSFPDGEKVSLRVPKISFTDLQFGELGKDVMISPRIAQAMIGIGFLEAVPEEILLEIAREQEKLGVAGKPNYVWDYENAKVALGRFGWKATQPNIRQQIASALIGDIGATTFYFPEKNCPSIQKACLDLPSASKCGGQGGCTGNQFRPEVMPSRINNLTRYLQTLGVPARRNPTAPEVAQGEKLFAQAKCAACHVPELTAGPKPEVAAMANITFHAYTDLLLHDMGPELADGRPDYQATGSEWRTPALWGIGLQQKVNGHSELLHDGRARNVTEAIIWHGGQAETAREAFKKMSKQDRAALVRFVESL